jgi:hypothetical protein
MEDKPNAKKLICPSDIWVMEETLRSLNENVLTMTSNEIKRETIKILGVNCRLSDFEKISLDKTEDTVLKLNYDKAKQAVSSHFTRGSRAKTIFIDEIETIFKLLYRKNTVAIPFNKFDVKVEILANGVSRFLDHRFDLIAQSEGATYEFMLENVVIFAAADGLAFEEILKSLVDKLQDEEKPITIVDDEIFIDLAYKKSGHATNTYYEENAITLRRWYPSSTSKTVITAFLKKKSLGVEEKKLSLASILKTALSRFNKTTDTPLTKTKKFFPALFISGLRLKRISIPYFLQHYATGTLYSASMPTESLLALHNKVIKKCFVDNQEERENINFRNIQNIQNNETEYLNDHVVLDDIKQILRDEIDQDQSRQITLTKLKQLRIKYDFNVQTEVFYEWILENITCNNWKHGLGTGNRYISAIGEVWSDTWKDVNILEAGSDDMDVLFEYMIEQRIETDSTARDTFFLLFKFIASRYTIAIPESVADNLSAWHVRSEFIPEHFYERLRSDLQSKYSAEFESFRLTVDVILIFLRRGLFRPSELFKLQMRDIESSEEMWIYLRKNVFGRVKTFSATRKMPLGVLLKPDERKIVDYFLSVRKVETENRSKALLFSQQTNHDVIFDSKTFLPQLTELLSSYAGHRLVSYQFRHSGISNLQLVLFGNIETATKFTSYSENQVLSIRQFFKTHENNLYYQLSSVAGHLSPRTTIGTYSHFTDLILGQCLHKAEVIQPLSFWANLSGISTTRLSNSLKSHHCINDQVSSHDITEFFDNQIKKHSLSAVQSAKPVLHESATLNVSLKPSLVHCERILKQYDNAKTTDDISIILTLPEKYVIAVVEAASIIKNHSSYQTNRGKSRLINSSSPSILPTKMQSKAEDVDRLKICEQLMANFANSPLFTKKIIHHLLSSVANDHSYISLNTVKRTGQFIHFFQPLVTKERWFIILHPPADFSNIEKWQIIKAKVEQMEVSDQTKKNKNLFPEGQANLYLMHPNAIDIKNKRPKQKMNKYSTNSLKNACHWVAIHLKSIQLFRE